MRCSPRFYSGNQFILWGEAGVCGSLPPALAQALCPALGGGYSAHGLDGCPVPGEVSPAAETASPFPFTAAAGVEGREPIAMGGLAILEGNGGQDGRAPAWYPVRLLPPLETTLMEQNCPADRVVRTLTPRLVSGGVRRIYDCGENITGYVVLRTQGEAGEEILVRHSEELAPAGDALDFTSCGGEGQNPVGGLCLRRLSPCLPSPFLLAGIPLF